MILSTAPSLSAAGARTGSVQVTTPSGTATSRSNFIVTTRNITITNPGAALKSYPVLVVVDTADALLIASRARTQEVRHVIHELRRRGMTGYI